MDPRQAESWSLLSRLRSAWGWKIKERAEKEGALAGIAGDGAPEPSRVAEIMRLLEQIAGFQQKERAIISEINAIEKKHHFLRQQKKLRRADAQEDDLARDKDVEERPERGFMAVLLWMLAFGRSKEKARKSEPGNG